MPSTSFIEHFPGILNGREIYHKSCRGRSIRWKEEIRKKRLHRHKLKKMLQLNKLRKKLERLQHKSKWTRVRLQNSGTSI